MGGEGLWRRLWVKEKVFGDVAIELFARGLCVATRQGWANER